MKRIVAIAFSTLALAATAAQAGAGGFPQPSFVDFIAVEQSAEKASSPASVAGAHRFPQPSFVDHVAIEADPSSGAAGSADTVSRITLPQPSFSG